MNTPTGLSNQYVTTIGSDDLSRSAIVWPSLCESLIQGALLTGTMWGSAAIILAGAYDVASLVAIMIVGCVFLWSSLVIWLFLVVRSASQRRRLPYDVVISNERLECRSAAESVAWPLSDCIAWKGNGFDALCEGGIWSGTCIVVSCQQKASIVALGRAESEQAEQLLIASETKWTKPMRPARFTFLIALLIVVAKLFCDVLILALGLNDGVRFLLYWVASIAVPRLGYGFVKRQIQRV